MIFLPYLTSLLMNRYTIGVIVVIGLMTGAYFKGKWSAESKCHEAELKAKIASMERDMKAWKDADYMANVLQQELEREHRQLQQKVSEYEAELATRPDNRCTLDQHDVDRLRFRQQR